MTTENPAVASRTSGDRMRDAGLSLLRVGGVFIVVLVVMVLFALLTGGKLLDPANLLGMLRAMSSVAILGMAAPGHRGRRDRPVLRLPLRPLCVDDRGRRTMWG